MLLGSWRWNSQAPGPAQYLAVRINLGALDEKNRLHKQVVERRLGA
jgi:hypothetical protein